MTAPLPPIVTLTPRPSPSSTGPLSALPRVLVVDDDPAMRAYVYDCLAPLHLQLSEAADGQDALDQIQDGLGDGLALVVTDVLMPRMDGLTLKAALAADPRWADVPVLLMTGEAVRARDGPVLRKPFNARRLGGAVRGLLHL